MATDDQVGPAEEEEIIDFEELRKMKVTDLRTKLNELGLPSKGTKQDLIARLEEFYTGQEDDEDLLDDEEGAGEDQDVGEDQEDEEEEEGEEEDGQEDEEEGHQEGEIAEKDAPVVQKESSGQQNPSKNGENSQPAIVEKINTNDVLVMSQAERLAVRAQKFGVVGEDAKKQARLQRFGLSTDASFPANKKLKVDDETLDKMKKRAERFGESVSNVVVKSDDLEKIKKRQERFGITGDDDKKLKRAERFGLS